MRDTIEFKVKFITPLLIHGADPKIPDAQGMAKALRGAWRFWFRAITGGILQSTFPPPADLSKAVYDKECEVFGSADEKVGTRFRMRVEPLTYDIDQMVDEFRLGFNVRGRNIPAEVQGYGPGATFKVIINPRSQVDFQKDSLLSTIWLWANLGSLGQRSRRGFGSPVILEESGGNFILSGNQGNLPVGESFESRKAIEDHLIDGLKKCWRCTASLTDEAGIPPIDSNDAPTNATFFILRSLKQVAVGKKSLQTYTPPEVTEITPKKNREPIYGLKDLPILTGLKDAAPTIDLTHAITQVHGNNACDELGFARNNGRLASPVYMRLHKVAANDKEEIYPVVTWSHPSSQPDNCARKWLEGIGFTKYLSGDQI